MKATAAPGHMTKYLLVDSNEHVIDSLEFSTDKVTWPAKYAADHWKEVLTERDDVSIYVRTGM